MKKTILIITFFLTGILTLQAQKKNTKVTLEVDGICGMCKKRIEKASLNTKGVKYANWNINSHYLTLIIDERKTNTKTIQQNIAKVGHDTKEVIATNEAYNSIHTCCKYRNDTIIKNHQGKLIKQEKNK